MLPGPQAATSGTAHLEVGQADTDNSRVRLVAVTTGTFYGRAMKAGDIYTVAGDSSGGFSGDGGPATRAAIAFPRSVAVGNAGSFVIADSANNRIRQVTG